jgi:hemerythrin-like domain-containing protein
VVHTREAPASRLLPDEDRPHVEPTTGMPITSTGEASAQLLVQVHDHLRHELAQILDAINAVVDGRLDVEAARSVINKTAIRQNAWALGSFCAQYCRVVTVHHTIEDRNLFPALGRENESLGSVLARLSEEHEIIAEVLDRFDRELVALVASPALLEGVQTLAQDLNDALLSHLAYEEDELTGPLSRSTIVI